MARRFDLDIRPTSIRAVNTVLAALGREERLTRGGDGYFYFREGDAPTWYSSSVCVSGPGSLTVRAWLREMERLSAEGAATASA